MPPAAVNHETGPLKILVADDTEANLLVISRFISRLGHSVVPARNGLEAVEAFARETPDMVLMDIMMPVMDGLEATRRIKAMAGQWVPIIIVSAKSHEQEQAQGLEAGADDYLAKPINFVILEAKINVMRRIAAMQRQITENAAQLGRYRDEAEEEQRIANDLMKRLIHAQGLKDPVLKHWVSPAKRFSGDLIAATRSLNNDLYVILADATGHGLPAALNLLPVSQIFYVMAERGFSVSHIAKEMNAKIAMLTPADRFVATVIACIDFREHVIEVWNGGNPSALFITHDGSILHEFRSHHLPLGILGQEDFNDETEIYHWDAKGQLVMCSDGLLEAENGEAEPFGWEQFQRRLSLVPSKKRFISLVAAVQEHLGNQSAHDDISLLIADCPKEAAPPLPASNDEIAPQQETGHWKLSYAISAPELYKLDLIPLLLHSLENLHISKTHNSHLFLIISELYNNALDHGLLKLDSSIKTRQPDGFDKYLALRQERLAALQQGEIEIQLEQFSIERRRMLRIRIKDSGAGFDHKKILGNRLEGNDTTCGRGIPLVKSLCTDIRYKGNGNEVVVYYALL